MFQEQNTGLKEMGVVGTYVLAHSHWRWLLKTKVVHKKQLKYVTFCSLLERTRIPRFLDFRVPIGSVTYKCTKS